MACPLPHKCDQRKVSGFSIHSVHDFFVTLSVGADGRDMV